MNKKVYYFLFNIHELFTIFQELTQQCQYLEEEI